MTYDKATKCLTLSSQEVDGEGKAGTFKGEVKKTGKDSLTWQALERTGGNLNGPSPVYAFSRAKKTD
jgi:hypothetical protein